MFKSQAGLKYKYLVTKCTKNVKFTFLEDTNVDVQVTHLLCPSAGVTKNYIIFLKIQLSFKSTLLQGSKPIIKGHRSQNGCRGSIVSAQHYSDLKG